MANPAEEKIRILLEGIRAEISVSELCRREGIHPTVDYAWLKDFHGGGKARMRGDALRDATTVRGAGPLQPSKVPRGADDEHHG